jgi:hypothetical protein
MSVKVDEKMWKGQRVEVPDYWTLQVRKIRDLVIRIYFL